jgi:integrase
MPRKARRRTWGTGSITERDGRWWIRWREGGRRRCKSFSSREVAEEALAKNIRDAEGDAEGLRRDYRQAPTLNELAKPWLERRAKTHRAADDDRLRWKNHLKPAFGHLRPCEVDAGKLRRFIEGKLAAGLSPTTCGHMVRQLSTFFEDVKEQGHLAVNPVSTLPRSTRRLYKSIYDVRKTPFLERPADIRRLYLALPEPHNVIFIFGEQTGCRVGEVLGMQWRDIDLPGRKIHVRQQMQDGALCMLKDRESRIVPLSTTLAPILEAWKLKTGGQGALFAPAHPTRGGRPDLGTEPGFIRPHTVHKALAKALKKCGLPPMTLYQCQRHSFASQWVMNGGSMEELARILGHSSTSTTAHYAHLAPDYFGAKAHDMVAVDLARPAGDVVSISRSSGVLGSEMGTAQEDSEEQRLAVLP